MEGTFLLIENEIADKSTHTINKRKVQRIKATLTKITTKVRKTFRSGTSLACSVAKN